MATLLFALLLAADEPAPPPYKISAYAEVFYQWNFNQPSNGITHFRGFDNRHNSFTIANAAVDLSWDWQDLVGRVALQIGHTPDTYYLSEPRLDGAPASNASGPPLWKFIQQAYVGYRFPLSFLLQGGIFLSPIGPEGMTVKDNWNWSRSSLFFGLPFYHTGLKLSYDVSDKLTLTAAAFNGWNSVVDNNQDKSWMLQSTYTEKGLITLNVLYFGGVERPSFASEGRAVRHLLDVHALLEAHPRVSFLIHVNAGFEPNTFGSSYWGGGAAYARVRLLDPLYIAVRVDALFEHQASNARGTATALFYGAEWVGSGTLTLDYRPIERVSMRLEWRYDRASAPLYFKGSVSRDAAGSFVANSNQQHTLTLGITSWF